MPELFVYLAGFLLTAGVYLILQRGLVQVLFGVVLMGNALNLAILAVGRVTGDPPIVPPGATEPLGPVSNPLPQALVLTALVISFGLTAFALALIGRVHRALGGIDTALLGEEDFPEELPLQDSEDPAEGRAGQRYPEGETALGEEA